MKNLEMHKDQENDTDNSKIYKMNRSRYIEVFKI